MPYADPPNRQHLLQQWLAPLAAPYALDLSTLVPASDDASFRRYFRVRGARSSFVVMDAPPPHETCQPFVQIAQRLRQTGVNAPAVLAQDLTQGFLLLSDLGACNYTQVIAAGLADTQRQALYRQAIAALVCMQGTPADGLPVWDQAQLLQELHVFCEWYVQGYYGVTLSATEQATLTQCFDALTQENLRQAQVFVHRDFHSPNLVLCTEAHHGTNPGVVDFQDAVAGPITYDLASLVMDARTTWDEAQQLDWAIRYWEAAQRAHLPIADDFADFHRAYEWMSLQRNLRILGVFARLYLRDNKPRYLAHLPRVLTYVRQVTTRYQAFRPVDRLLDRLQALEPVPQDSPICAP